jgi:2-polyprenyl-6-hydroxyphenyl methylase/3-demethylubiquinone-9 3-methyltransferase
MSMVSENGSNVDEAEVAKFNALASRWWDPDGDFRPLHEINPLRLDWIRQQVNLHSNKVVDIGCGGGILAESMAMAGAEVLGIDMADGPLAVARLHQAESGAEVTYEQMTAEALASNRPGEFDIVTCLEMLEHVPDPVSVVSACSKLLKPGGHCFMSTLNRTPASFAMAIVGAEHIAGLIPKGTHRYDRFIRPSELSSWSRSAGLEIKEICGLHYNPLSRTARLGGNVLVNYLVHAVKVESNQ